MSITLTDQQAEIVRQNRLNEEDLPSYYSADLQRDVVISRDFEAFLILSSPDLKTAANNWIQNAASLQTTNSKRDQLVQLSTQQEASNAQRKQDALNVTLGEFEKFRQQFQTQTDFADIPEVQQFLFDLQRVVEEKSIALERAEFDGAASQVVTLGNDRTNISSDEIEELQSWTGVISQYLKG